MDVVRAARAQGKSVGIAMTDQETAGADLLEHAMRVPAGIVDVVVGIVGTAYENDSVFGYTEAGCDFFLGKGVRICAACHVKSPNMSKCSGCKLAYYCGETCQQSHWKSHRSYCKKIAAVHKMIVENGGMDAVVELMRGNRV